MFNIKNYLGKFSKRAESEEIKRKVIAEIFREVAGAEISEKSVRFRGTAVEISAPVETKPVIFMRREKILSEIRKRVSGNVIDRIDLR